MAFQKAHTDEFGDFYPESYWRVVECNVCKADGRGRVLFYGYESAAKAGGRIIGQKAYDVNPEQYQEYFAPGELSPEGKNPWEAAYRLAKAVEDTGEGDDKSSFFAGAGGA